MIHTDGGGGGKLMLTEIELTAATPFNPDYTLGLDGTWRRTVDKLDEAGRKIKIKRDGKDTTRNEKETITYEDKASIPERDRWGRARIELVSALLPVRDRMKRQLRLEAEDAPLNQIEANRAELNRAYDRSSPGMAECTPPGLQKSPL